MRSSDDFKGQDVISAADGKKLGYVQDLYVDSNFYWLTGIYLGHEGLIRRRAKLIPRDRITLFGIDVILVDDSNALTDDREHAAASDWRLLKKVRKRTVDTPNGTPIGTLDSVYLDEYIAILQEESAASVRLEPGVICIYPMFQKDNPTEIRLLEIYANKAAYESHLQTPHFQKYKTATMHMVKSLQLIDMEAIDEETMPQLFRKLDKYGS